MISRKNWDGKRLESLTHDEMKTLLTNRVKDFVERGFSTGHNGRSMAYTPHIQGIVEILNAIVKGGNYGDGLHEILMATTEYPASPGNLAITKDGVEPSLYGRVTTCEDDGFVLVGGVKVSKDNLLRL